MRERDIFPIRRPQFETLMALQKFVDDNGYSPSVRQIMPLAGINSSGVINDYLDDLETYGYIKRVRNERGRARPHTISILTKPCLAPLDFDPNEVFKKDGQE